MDDAAEVFNQFLQLLTQPVGIPILIFLGFLVLALGLIVAMWVWGIRRALREDAQVRRRITAPIVKVSPGVLEVFWFEAVGDSYATYGRVRLPDGRTVDADKIEWSWLVFTLWILSQIPFVTPRRTQPRTQAGRTLRTRQVDFP